VAAIEEALGSPMRMKTSVLMPQAILQSANKPVHRGVGRCLGILDPSRTLQLITSFCNYVKLTTVDIDLARLFAFADFCVRWGVVQQEIIGITLLQELLTTGPCSKKLTTFAVDSGLVEFLVRRQLHVDVFRRWAQLLSHAGHFGILQPDLIQEIWRKAADDATSNQTKIRNTTCMIVS
jgi:hypothetical protein